MASIPASTVNALLSKKDDTVTFFPYKFRYQTTSNGSFIALQSGNDHRHLLLSKEVKEASNQRCHYSLIEEAAARSIPNRPDIVQAIEFLPPLFSSTEKLYTMLTIDSPGDLPHFQPHSSFPSRLSPRPSPLEELPMANRESASGNRISRFPPGPESEGKLIPSKRKNSEDEMGNCALKYLYRH
jgi:hypothetical protein